MILKKDKTQIANMKEMFVESNLINDEKKVSNKPFNSGEGMGLSIYKIKEVKLLLANQSRTSTLKPRLEAMLGEGDWRPYTMVTKELMSSWEQLRQKFPNFTDVINRYEKTLLLAQLTPPAVIYVPPILLLGEPGIGKTRFLRELAKLLQVDFFQADLATTSAGFVLAGSSSSWAEGKPGMVSDSLRKSSVANFVFLIDEIDKVSGDSRYDPLGCLYSLLEHDTAAYFKDEALQVELNCSGINWFASANYLDKIPDPIKSRFNIFEIKMPSPKQMHKVTLSVYHDLRSDHKWGSMFSSVLAKQVVKKLSSLNPREQKRVLFDACSEAAFRYKNDVKKRGVIRLKEEDIILLNSEPKKRAIGFY